MNVYDIVSQNEQLDEAPVGSIKQGLRRVGAKAAGAVGMSRTAGNLGAKADAGAEANKLEKGFSSYLGKQMKNVKQATAQDLARYLKQQGYPIDHMKGMKGILQPQQLDDVVLKSVTKKSAGDDVPGVGGDDAPAAQPAQSKPAKKKGKTAAGNNKPAQASGQKPRLPAKLMSQVNQLSDQQKQALKRLL